ncbi:hypothetical protein BDW71DRAFT_202895 [Aspergillus fruticulosus]
MFSIYPRPRPAPTNPSTSTPTTSLPHLSYILSLDPSHDPRCAGYMHTHGRRCTVETNLQNRTEAITLLNTATADLHAGRWRFIDINDTLEELARCVLCSEISHQAQAPTLVERWRADIEAFVRGYGLISVFSNVDATPEWDVVSMNTSNESWRERAYRGVWGVFGKLRCAQLVPRMDSGNSRASWVSAGNSIHQHVQGSDSDWNRNVDYEYAYDHDRHDDYNYEYEYDSTRPTSNERTTSTSTNTSTGPVIYTQPYTHTQHIPTDIPAQDQTPDAVFGLSPPAPDNIEMPHDYGSNTSTSIKLKNNTVERLRQPVDGDCSICLVSLLDQPSGFDYDPDSGRKRADTDYPPSPSADSIFQWHDTSTGVWAYTDFIGREYEYQPVLSCVREVEPDVDIKREGKEEEETYPTRPELSWCRAGCGVNYHKRCIDRWVAMAPSGLATCPSCRRRWAGGGSRDGGSSYGVSFRGRR